MSNVQLTIKKVQKISTTFKNETPYSVFTCTTTDGKDLEVAITKNMLSNVVGINEKLLSDLVGSTVVVEDQNYVNPLTKVTEFTPAEQRVSDVLNKVPNRSIILINPTNGSVIKSDPLSELIRESADNIDAKVIVSREKDARLDKLKRAQELAASLLPPVSTLRVVENVGAENDEEVPF